MTPAECREYLILLVEEARTHTRRGPMGTLSAEYAEVHEAMNAGLDALGV